MWVQLRSHWDACRECTSGNEAAGYQYGIKTAFDSMFSARPGKLSKS